MLVFNVLNLGGKVYLRDQKRCWHGNFASRWMSFKVIHRLITVLCLNSRLTMQLASHSHNLILFPRAVLQHNTNFIYILYLLITHEYFSFTVKHLKLEKNTSQNVSQFESLAEKGDSPHFTVWFVSWNEINHRCCSRLSLKKMQYHRGLSCNLLLFIQRDFLLFHN